MTRDATKPGEEHVDVHAFDHPATYVVSLRSHNSKFFPFFCRTFPFAQLLTSFSATDSANCLATGRFARIVQERSPGYSSSRSRRRYGRSDDELQGNGRSHSLAAWRRLGFDSDYLIVVGVGLISIYDLSLNYFVRFVSLFTSLFRCNTRALISSIFRSFPLCSQLQPMLSSKLQPTLKSAIVRRILGGEC